LRRYSPSGGEPVGSYSILRGYSITASELLLNPHFSKPTAVLTLTSIEGGANLFNRAALAYDLRGQRPGSLPLHLLRRDFNAVLHPEGHGGSAQASRSNRRSIV